MNYCTHDECRKHTMQDLLYLANNKMLTMDRRIEIINAADDVYKSQVPCRIKPRPGPVYAPLPEEAEDFVPSIRRAGGA